MAGTGHEVGLGFDDVRNCLVLLLIPALLQNAVASALLLSGVLALSFFIVMIYRKDLQDETGTKS